jgi:hypothetical protein
MAGISAEREQTRNHFFSEFSKERHGTLEDLLAEEKTYSRLLAEMRDTLQSGNQLILSASELLKILPVPDEAASDSSPDEAAQPMTIDDYRAALSDL